LPRWVGRYIDLVTRRALRQVRDHHLGAGYKRRMVFIDLARKARVAGARERCWGPWLAGGDAGMRPAIALRGEEARRKKDTNAGQRL